MTIDRIAPTHRPAGKSDGTQRWRDLLFVHWEVSVDSARALLPVGLELDLWDGKALVGLVPFRMEAVRPAWLPQSLAQSFLETNVRLYVTHDGRPGVYFVSLEAASWTAVQAARIGWGLPYFHAAMSSAREAERVHYRSRRRTQSWGGARGAGAKRPRLDVEYSVGSALPAAEPSSLEFFLLERYLLFVERSGEIRCGQVHHTPYPAHAATVHRIEEELIAAGGLDRNGDIFAAHFSPGVDVEVFGFESASTREGGS